MRVTSKMNPAVVAMEGPGSLFALSRMVELTAEDSKSHRTGVDPLETQAIDSVKAGDVTPYDYLVSKYMKRVVSIAWGILRSAQDAEDLAQEAFVKAFETMGRFKSGQPFGPWIYRIVTNLALDVLKHRRRFQQQALSENEEAPRSDEADLLTKSNEISSRIDRAIQSLPEMQRIVARLFLVEEFGHSEIAEMMRLSEGTVRSHLSLARRKLQEKLADLHEETA